MAVIGRPTRLEIDLAALRHNFQQIRRTVGSDCEILAVVKANAYGHGVARVAPELAAAGADQFAVAMVDEGAELRGLGIAQPVIVMGGLFTGEEDTVLEHHLSPVLYALTAAERLNAAARRAGRSVDYHLKVDSGMGRLGFRPEQLAEVLPQLRNLKSLNMVGVMSHLAVADEPERPLTDAQVGCFREICHQVTSHGFSPRYRHIANSAAIHSRDLAGCNLVRPGIALYGGLTGATATEAAAQRQVMRLVSAVAQVKDVPPGEGVSYGHRFVTSRHSRLAAVPIGYADGYNRLLSNRGDVLIHGQRAPVAGTVCMDWILVDVTELPDVQVGDRIVLLGHDGQDVITAEEWAEKVGSITYEVFCNFSKRVPRVFLGETPK